MENYSRDPVLLAATPPIDPNELIDTTGIGWEEVVLATIVIVVAAIIAAFARRIVRSAALSWFKDKPDLAVFLARLTGWFVILLGVVGALMILGFQLGPMFLIVAVVGLILFLSARSLLENLGAGVVLQTENPFRIGDWVEVGDESGNVQDITGRTTVIDTFDGRRIRIPNTTVLAEPIINYSERRQLRSEVEVGVEYGTDLDHAQKVIIDTLGGIDGVLGHPAPEAPVLEFGASSIDFAARFWHEPSVHARYQMVDRVARAIDRRFKEEGIVIAFPQVVVWKAEDGED